MLCFASTMLIHMMVLACLAHSPAVPSPIAGPSHVKAEGIEGTHFYHSPQTIPGAPATTTSLFCNSCGSDSYYGTGTLSSTAERVLTERGQGSPHLSYSWREVTLLIMHRHSKPLNNVKSLNKDPLCPRNSPPRVVGRAHSAHHYYPSYRATCLQLVWYPYPRNGEVLCHLASLCEA